MQSMLRERTPGALQRGNSERREQVPREPYGSTPGAPCSLAPGNLAVYAPVTHRGAMQHAPRHAVHRGITRAGECHATRPRMSERRGMSTRHGERGGCPPRERRGSVSHAGSTRAGGAPREPGSGSTTRAGSSPAHTPCSECHGSAGEPWEYHTPRHAIQSMSRGNTPPPATIIFML